MISFSTPSRSRSARRSAGVVGRGLAPRRLLHSNPTSFISSMWAKTPFVYGRNPGPTPFHMPRSTASTNQWQPSSSSSTRGTRSFHLAGACEDQRSGGQYVRSM